MDVKSCIINWVGSGLQSSEACQIWAAGNSREGAVGMKGLD